MYQYTHIDCRCAGERVAEPGVVVRRGGVQQRRRRRGGEERGRGEQLQHAHARVAPGGNRRPQEDAPRALLYAARKTTASACILRWNLGMLLYHSCCCIQCRVEIENHEKYTRPGVTHAHTHVQSYPYRLGLHVLQRQVALGSTPSSQTARTSEVVLGTAGSDTEMPKLQSIDAASMAACEKTVPPPHEPTLSAQSNAVTSAVADEALTPPPRLNLAATSDLPQPQQDAADVSTTPQHSFPPQVCLSARHRSTASRHRYVYQHDTAAQLPATGVSISTTPQHSFPPQVCLSAQHRSTHSRHRYASVTAYHTAGLYSTLSTQRPSLERCLTVRAHACS